MTFMPESIGLPHDRRKPERCAERDFLVSSKTEEARAIRPGLLF